MKTDELKTILDTWWHASTSLDHGFDIPESGRALIIGGLPDPQTFLLLWPEHVAHLVNFPRHLSAKLSDLSDELREAELDLLNTFKACTQTWGLRSFCFPILFRAGPNGSVDSLV